MKKTVTLFIITILLLFLTGVTVTAANDDIKVYVDGAKIKFIDQKPYINSDNRTLVPVRFVSEALGAKVDWISSTKTVRIDYNGKIIALEIGSPKATVDTSVVTLDTVPAITKSRTMVPLRFVSECLDAEVEWKAAESAVYIVTADSDLNLVSSDLIINPLYPDSKPGDLSVSILYKYNTPLEPQLNDLKELLEKRFGSKAQEIVDYIAVKKEAQSRILDKTWVINGKT